MAQKFTNAARALLAATINSTDTSLSIESGGSLFPVADTGTASIGPGADWFKLVLQDATNYEIVYVRTHTSGSTSFSNILRGQEGTTAVGFAAGSVVALRPTAEDANHVNNTSNPHGVTKAQVGLGSVDNTADAAKNVLSATKLTTARTITLDGDVSGSASFDGSANVTITTTVADDSHAHLIADVDGLQTALDGKAASSHTHSIANVTGLQTALDAKAPAASPTFTGAIAANGSYRQAAQAVSALAIDCSLGNYFTKTINANSTFTVSNVPASGTSYSFVLELTHTSGTITWFSGVIWPGGTAPTLTTGKVHLFVFATDNGGTTWRAAALADYAS